MIEPAPFEDIDLTEVTQTRRIPVWKHRAKSWRTRVPDHVTDGRIKKGRLFPSLAPTMPLLMCRLHPSAVHDAGLRPVFGNVMFRRPFVVARFLLNILTVSGGVCGRRTFLGFTTPGNAIRGDQRGVRMASIRESIGLGHPDIRWCTAWSICR